MNPLQTRLAAVRRWLRLVVVVRGVCLLASLVLLGAAVEGMLDWVLHLPGLVRAVILVGTLAGSGLVAYRLLLQPLTTRTDDLSLALRIEAIYPHLNDSLASTVQFLEQGRTESHASASLRREAVLRTLKEVHSFDFGRVVDTRGVGLAMLALTVAGFLALPLVLFFPFLAATALERLAVPFGDREWPRQTRLEITARTRVARGEPYEIHALVSGVIPESAHIAYEGLTPARQSYPIRNDSSRGTLHARLDRVERSFRFQVQANDAVSDWHVVTVLPPPVLVPLDGRPTPHVRLRYPAYTDLPVQDLPDGTGNIEAVFGTHATLRAAVDRPIARAWIEYRPEHPLARLSAQLGFLGAGDVPGVLARSAAAHEIGAPLPARIDKNGQVIQLDFCPRVRGMYALRFEDESGLGNTRLFDLRLLADPAPAVNLERPSRSQDSLRVLPVAEFTLQALVEDPQFAIRSAYLVYRCKNSAGDADPPGRLPLYDHQAVGATLPRLLPAAVPGTPSLRLRPHRLEIDRRLSVRQFRFRDGRPLQEGDVLVLQACAEDFDDVAVDKQPGQSHEVELHIVGLPVLEALLNRAQAQVQEELLRLRKEQQEATEHVIGAEQRWRNTGKLRPQDIDRLLQAEQLQQQIQARVGNRQEGLRAEVARILQTLRDNLLPRSGTHDRMEVVASELERLAREELEQIEPRLTNARKENETAVEAKPPAADAKGSLGEARRHQEEVENTFNELLKLLEPWGNISAVKGEARAVLQEQRKLHEETRSLDTPATSGRKQAELPPGQKASLDKVAELQRKLEERTGQLLGRMQRASDERREKDPEMAAALKEAADKARDGALQENMKEARHNIRDNNLGKAGDLQKAGIGALEAMVKALEERREQELDQLRKKLKEVEERLDQLAKDQDELRKKVKEARQLTDAAQREQELKQLARAQEQLRKEAQETLRELTRLRAEPAKQALGGASERMEQAARQLERGQDADEEQEEVLHRLNEARRRLQQLQAEVEEELAREKLAKVADQLKLLKERQEEALAETARIQQRVLQKQSWDRISLTNLGRWAQVQKDLGQDTDNLAKGKLADAQVFARILSRAAEAMEQAAERLAQHLEKVKAKPDDISAAEDATRLQRRALRYFEQLLAALKTEQARRNPGGDGQGGGGQGGARARQSDGISQLAQLKLLRSLQNEINDLTETFSKKHSDLDKLTQEQQRELLSIRKEQQEIADLLEELLAPPEEKP